MKTREGEKERELTTTKTTSELNIFGLDSDTLGVDSSQVGVFEEGEHGGAKLIQIVIPRLSGKNWSNTIRAYFIRIVQQTYTGTLTHSVY